MISADERSAILSEVERFGERTLAPLTQLPEHPPDQSRLREALTQAMAMGILPQVGEPGFGLWELVDDSNGFQLHLEVLTSLARYNAALALEMHLTALSQHILRLGGVDCPGNVSVALDGHGSLARYSLARYLASNSLEAEDIEILRQHFNVGSETSPFYFSTLSAEFVLLPVWHLNGRIEWHLYSEADLITEILRVHGLDEIGHYQARLDSSANPIAVVSADPAGSAQYAVVLAIHSAALFAIQSGIASAAYGRAKIYAANRNQGGCLIQEHPAVQQMLMNSRAGARISDALLKSLPVPRGIAALSEIMEKRAAMQEQLYSSVTDALQVFGGYGYMQDYGLEKLLRDQNHLGQLGGSVENARLFLAALENPKTLAEAI